MGGGGGYNPNIMPGDNIIMWTDTGGSTGTNNVSSALVLSGKDNYGGIRIRPNGVSLNTPYDTPGATASDALYVTGSVNITGEYLVNGVAPSDSQWTGGSTGIYYGSYVTIGQSTLSTSYALYVNGTIGASSTITAGSDYRIKEDIKPLQLEDYSVDNLNPVTFKFKKDGKKSIGVIAHELQEYFPFLVEGEKDGEQTQTVNYNGLIGVLIKEIQELKARVKELEKRIGEQNLVKRI
jgi:hypothetical protein